MRHGSPPPNTNRVARNDQSWRQLAALEFVRRRFDAIQNVVHQTRVVTEPRAVATGSADCGMRISDFGFEFSNPQSAICNRLIRSLPLAVLTLLVNQPSQLAPIDIAVAILSGLKCSIFAKGESMKIKSSVTRVLVMSAILISALASSSGIAFSARAQGRGGGRPGGQNLSPEEQNLAKGIMTAAGDGRVAKSEPRAGVSKDF